MRIVKVGVLAPTNKGIPLGVQGENRATQVEFDTRPWFREYPYGTVSAVAMRDGDHAPYPLTLDVADGTAVWQVSDTDTAKAGVGAVELTMTSGGARVRSLTFKTLVTASLTDSPVDDDAWYGWLDKAVVKVDETVQSAQRKMDEVDLEWTALKSDMTEKVEECGEVAAQAATDAHHAKVDAQATAKALESAEGSVAKAEAAANRAVDASLAADDSAVEASNSALSARESAEAASGSATNAATSASEAATSASSAADAASAASGSASAAEQSATDASNAKVAAQTAKSEAATSASSAADSAKAAAKSASDAAASVGAINVIAPLHTATSATADNTALAIGNSAHSYGSYSIAIGASSNCGNNSSVAIGDSARTTRDEEFSIGSISGGRYLANVKSPKLDSDASTKKYTDDNDAKTLTEAKKYTDDNTSNALIGKVSGKLLHVEDAWPGKPLGLTIDGAYKQEGTPSPDNPVPIEVIENPVLIVTGKNLQKYPFPYGHPKEDNLNGVVVTDNGDGSVTAIGTPSIESYYNLDFTSDFKFARGADIVVSNRTNPSYHVEVITDSGNVPCINSITKLTNKVPDDALKTRSFLVFSAGVSHNVTVFPQYEVGTTATTYKPYVGAHLPITLPAEHPYLAALPDGTHDEIVIDKDGNASLIARVGKVLVAEQTISVYTTTTTPYATFNLTTLSGVANALACNTHNPVQYSEASGTIYSPNGTDIVIRDSRFTSLEVAKEALANTVLYYYITAPVTYHLDQLDIPSLPETISNVWTDAELTTNMSMTYKRDINIAFDNLVQAVVAAAAGE